MGSYKTKSSKGQIIVFEQVLLFSMGIAIFVTCFTLFVMYQSHYVSLTSEDHMSNLKEYITSNILELSRKGDLNASVVLKIPKTIGNEFYNISLSNSGLNITLLATGKYKESSLYELGKQEPGEGMELSGGVTSDRGKIVIYKTGNSINIK